MTITIGSLFSGIGGLELGLEAAIPGARVVWQGEQDDYARSVLARHWPDVDRSITDVRDAGSASLRPVTLICGGFPCQDVSIANATGKGLDGERSGLWFEFERVVGELRPAAVVVENVYHGAMRWLPVVRRCLWSIGYASVPLRLSAEEVGAPHQRRRVFIVAHTDGQQLRQLSRRWTGENRQDEPIPRVDGSAWNVARRRTLSDTDSTRLNPRQGMGPAWPPSLGEGWWNSEPDVGRVADGVPDGVDRRRCLGNAVVPQCAYVVGAYLAPLLTQEP